MRCPRCRSRDTGRDDGPVLPQKLVVREILVRLPAKALLRCRAVCRSWRRRTSERSFLLAHHRHQPALPLVTFKEEIPSRSVNDRNTVFVNATVETLDLRRTPAERQRVLGFNDYNDHRGFDVHASCDGLLLLSLENHGFYICNPATRQWISLPRFMTGASGASLYQHAPSTQYRVIYYNRGRPADGRVVYHVVTVGSNAAPRRVETGTPCPTAERIITRGWANDSERSGVLLNGCLHCLPHGPSMEAVLIVFDTVAESFRTMASPVAAGRRRPQLLVMDDSLAFSWVHESNVMMKQWVLQDYENEVWVLKRRIIFPAVEMKTILQVDRLYLREMVVSEDGDALLHCPFAWPNKRLAFHLFHSDNKGELARHFRWDGVIPTPSGHWFKESLVRHEFFEKRGAAGTSTQPRFFGGL